MTGIVRNLWSLSETDHLRGELKEILAIDLRGGERLGAWWFGWVATHWVATHYPSQMLVGHEGVHKEVEIGE